MGTVSGHFEQGSNPCFRLLPMRSTSLMQDGTLASSAAVKAKHIAEVVASYPQSGGTYAFSRNPDGTFDSKSTIFPAVALWSQRVSLPSPNAMLTQWSSRHFETYWGARSASDAYFYTHRRNGVERNETFSSSGKLRISRAMSRISTLTTGAMLSLR
jgi:hypothetical protein